MIELRNVTKKYSDKTILAGVNAQIEAGCIYGIVGTNGVGKTTLLRLMAGFLTLTAGEIIINGIQQGKDSNLEGLSFVPDHSALYEYLTGEEYLLFAAAMFDISKTERLSLVSQMIKLFNLEQARDHIIATYSNGMKQKISIASAIITRPSILLLDEPLTGIDMLSSEIIKDYLREFSKSNTVILTTHLLELAHALCHKIGILHNGVIVEEFYTQDLSLKNIYEKIKFAYLSDTTKGISCSSREDCRA